MTYIKPAMIESIKANYRCEDIARNYTELSGSKELYGPCPKCGGEDRYRIMESGRWFCRQCHPKTDDVIGLVMWLQGIGFTDACKYLTSGYIPSEPVKKLVSRPKPDATELLGIATMANTTLFDTTKGIEGRQYLFSRGIKMSTAQSFLLGYAGMAHGVGFGITIPWIGDDKNVVAIQYRNVSQRGYRYSCATGSNRTGWFGLNLLTGTDTLMVVEGEFNAMSIWQELQDHGVMMDVISSGTESRLTPKNLAPVSSCYNRTVLWADQSKMTERVASEMGVSTLTSAVVDDLKLDASALSQARELWSFLTTAGVV